MRVKSESERIQSRTDTGNYDTRSLELTTAVREDADPQLISGCSSGSARFSLLSCSHTAVPPPTLRWQWDRWMKRTTCSLKLLRAAAEAKS